MLKKLMMNAKKADHVGIMCLVCGKKEAAIQSLFLLTQPFEDRAFLLFFNFLRIS